MKLTDKQIKQIKELKEKGLRPIDISRELKISYATVLYHYSEKYRKNQINYQLNYQKKNKIKRTERLRKYQREYQKERYWRLKNEK